MDRSYLRGLTVTMLPLQVRIHAGEVNGQPSWYEHVISAHYPRDINFNGNYCQDGIQDLGESGVDSGWPCP